MHQTALSPGHRLSILQLFVGFQVIDAEPGTERDQV